MTEHLQILVLSSKGHRRHIETLANRRGGRLRPGQRVQMEGRKNVYVVLGVDDARHLADLLCLDGSLHRVEAGIPLALLRPAKGLAGKLEVPA